IHEGPLLDWTRPSAAPGVQASGGALRIDDSGMTCKGRTVRREPGMVTPCCLRNVAHGLLRGLDPTNNHFRDPKCGAYSFVQIDRGHRWSLDVSGARVSS